MMEFLLHKILHFYHQAKMKATYKEVQAFYKPFRSQVPCLSNRVTNDNQMCGNPFKSIVKCFFALNISSFLRYSGNSPMHEKHDTISFKCLSSCFAHSSVIEEIHRCTRNTTLLALNAYLVVSRRVSAWQSSIQNSEETFRV